ncbi:cyd operon YbgE family protein [Parasutterella excrementihominis]|uniref:cyd operon YbgE family protein n=1 Tax=Parasutterella excrementihominis TaxID=487175 RepID=UPI002676DB0F|nr:cyd operon YbgE family protein [Parasutterella excrementihominis]
MRILSFLIALSVAAFVIIYPRAIASDMSSVPHGWLVLLLLGMSFCFVYGVGFKARNRFLAFLFSPLVAWTCVGVASFMIFSDTRSLTVSVIKSLAGLRPRGFLCL